MVRFYRSTLNGFWLFIWLIIGVALSFLACGCCAKPQVGTLGSGIYPGRLEESGAPVVSPAGREYRNLALFRAARHSSSSDFDRTAQLVTDGVLPGESDYCSAWKSGTGASEWLVVDLGAGARVEEMAFYWLNPPQSFTVWYSGDGNGWKKALSVAGGQPHDRVSFRAVRGRYFKLEMDLPQDGEPLELGEWEIYGRGGVAARPRPAPGRSGNRQELTRGGWLLSRASGVRSTGEEISGPDYDAAGWIPATVPGTVLASYVNIGAVPDPNYADNQFFISESYFHSDFWYRNTFSAHLDSERQFLNFDGVNWKAEVYLNGRRLGRIESAFRDESFDVTGILAEGRNDLAVRIVCNEHFGEATLQSAFSSGPNGGLPGADNPTMHASIGWDWLPTVRGRNMGIYDDVYLTFTGPVTLEDAFVRTELPLPDTSYADVLAQAMLVNHADRPVSGEIEFVLGSETARMPVLLDAGEERLVHMDTIRIGNPDLWWPNGYGRPYLYNTGFSFVADGGLSDSLSFKTGIRQVNVSYDTAAPSRDGCTDRINLYVNGKRFVGFGGNWGFSEHLMNYRAREYDAAVKYHADMHFTMIRNWVGQIPDKEFYEACDRYGILVWQDFWLANPYDGPDPENVSVFTETALRTVRRIRNHPCIGIYVGRNEGNPPEDIDRSLRGIVGTEHPGMHYISHSSEGAVSGGGPYRALPSADYYTLFGAEKFHSERGMPAPMNYENLVRAVGKDNVEPYSSMSHPNPMYGLHDYTLGQISGASSAQRADTFNKMLEKAFGEPADAKEFTRWAQWISYDGYRAIFEGRSPARQGILLWMSHPAWPSMVWQTYDYFLEPLASYFGCKKACEPVHVFLNPLSETVQAVNWYGTHGESYHVMAEILDQAGRRLWLREADIFIGPDETVTCFPAEYPEERPEVCFVRLFLSKADGTPVSENIYWRGREEGNYTALKTVPPARLAGNVRRRVSGEWTVLALDLENSGDSPAMMLRVMALDSKSGGLVLPVLYSDNYFFLMPGERKTVEVRLRKEDIAGEAELAVSGFNVEDKKFF